LNARGDIKKFVVDNRDVYLKQIPIEEAKRTGINIDLGPDSLTRYVLEIELTDRIFTLYTTEMRERDSMVHFIEQILEYKN